jgi:N utilization substance protein B
MGTRRKSREMVLQMLFQLDLGKQTPEHVRTTFWKERAEVDEETRGFADDIFRIATEAPAPGRDIDSIIEQHAQNWRIDRMAAVDRNLLRAAVAEMFGYPDTPRPVIINESIEIARKFSSPESVNFINGVLDGISHDLPSAPPKPRKK